MVQPCSYSVGALGHRSALGGGRGWGYTEALRIVMIVMTYDNLSADAISSVKELHSWTASMEA